MNNLEILSKVREKLLAIVVAATGNVSLASTTTGFTRLTGSFLDDGLVAGMEVKPAGFTDNTPNVIQSLTALEIKTFTARTVEASAPNRSLTVGIPSIVAWENKPVTLVNNRWYLDEDYDPGVSWSERITANAPFEHNPQWIGKLYGLSGTSVTALYIVADAILEDFRPFSIIAVMPDGYRLRVSGEPQPYRGQLVPDDAGRAYIPITIPLRKRAA